MSFLKIVVGKMLRETAQETFVDQIHKDTGISKGKLNEVFFSGMSLMTSIDADPIIMGKSAVYKLLDELGDDAIEEQKASKHCTCPYDDDDDSKDIGTDPKCPIHGKNGSNVNENVDDRRAQLRRRKLPSVSLDCDKCKGDGCKECAWTGRKNLESVREDDEEKPVYRIYDRKDKVWMGKPSTHVKRLRNRVDKLDNEYGAYRYQARPYKG